MRGPGIEPRQVAAILRGIRSVRIIDLVPPGPVQFAKRGSLSCVNRRIACRKSLARKSRQARVKERATLQVHRKA